jgi:hypothetical protein
MRNPNRIKPFLAKLEEYWMQNPELRFGQVIFLLQSQSVVDPFYVEDDRWLSKINKLIRRSSNEQS